MVIFVIKILISWLLFIWVWIKISWKYRQKITKRKKINEEAFYSFVKRYSSYLFWIYKEGKITLINKELWNEKSNFIIINQSHYLFILFLLKKNNFQIHAPVSLILLKEKITNWPKILVKFFSLINHFSFKNHHLNENKKKIELAIQNITIPRSMIVILDRENQKKWSSLLDIAYGGYSQLLIIDIKREEKTTKMKIKKYLTAKNLITMKKETILQMINK